MFSCEEVVDFIVRLNLPSTYLYILVILFRWVELSAGSVRVLGLFSDPTQLTERELPNSETRIMLKSKVILRGS